MEGDTGVAVVSTAVRQSRSTRQSDHAIRSRSRNGQTEATMLLWPDLPVGVTC